MARGAVETTNIAAKLLSLPAQEAYNQLSLPDNYRLIDHLFQPNSYTVMGFKAGALYHFASDSRVLANALTIASL